MAKGIDLKVTIIRRGLKINAVAASMGWSPQKLSGLLNTFTDVPPNDAAAIKTAIIRMTGGGLPDSGDDHNES
ncbi:MAG: hypothetical protein WCX65_05100 [bacterium]